MCEIDRDNDTMKEVDEFVDGFVIHGLECGNEIATIAKELHPDAVAIIPLYRSCLVVEQNDKDKKEGMCTMHGYSDPHWCGKELDIETLQSDEFHVMFIVQGRREGPEIFLENTNNNR